VLNKNYIENNAVLAYEEYLEKLSNLNPIKGFIYKNYCLSGGSERQYFSDENGMIIDAMRQEIEKLKSQSVIKDGFVLFFIGNFIRKCRCGGQHRRRLRRFFKTIKKIGREKTDFKTCSF